jgi:hypothetical protein
MKFSTRIEDVHVQWILMNLELTDLNRVSVYNAEFEWNAFWLKGFYRKGHYHWAYEGDFFWLSWSNYMVQTYNGHTWYWVKGTNGFKAVFWTSLWWELTQPYYWSTAKIGKFDLTGIGYIANAGDAVTSGFIPLPTRRVTFMGKRNWVL